MNEQLPKRIDDVDRYIGMRMRWRRRSLEISQQQLADCVGTIFQMVHKYERGVNRIAASRLYDIAKALGVRVDYFYEGYGDGDNAPETGGMYPLLLQLTEDFNAILDRRQQEAVCQLARALTAPDVIDEPGIEGAA